MYEEIYEYDPIQYWVKLNSHKKQSTRGKWHRFDKKHRDSLYAFQCNHCQELVYTQPILSGVQNRNHCPYCLWSRHVDHAHPGDRMSACKAIMQPIGLTLKRWQKKYAGKSYGGERYGELMLIHRCHDCGKLSINRIAADDQTERLMELYNESLLLDASTRNQLEAIGIQLLQVDDARLVVSQLWGSTQTLK